MDHGPWTMDQASYTVSMLRKAVVAMLGVIALAAVFFASGYRLTLDGSGKMPRFVGKTPDYDALEADRARHRAASSAGSELPRADPSLASAAPAAATPAVEVLPAARTSAAEPGSSWTDFRGPNRDGRYTATAIRTDWPREGLPLVWKQPVGGGYASFVVADGRAFTIEQRRDREVVAAYDVKTGRELWTHAWTANFQEGMGGDGPRATPTYHEGRVYALGAEGELRALDAVKGTLVWRHNILDENDARNLSWGMSAAPLIVDGKVIVLPGGARGRSIVAYDAATGAPVWQSQNDDQAYTSPMLVTLSGVRQILVVSSTRAMGLDVGTGGLLWHYPWDTFNGINVAQPILFTHEGRDRVFLSASYGKGSAVFELTREGDRFQTKTIWENQRMKNKFSSSVFRDGFIYGLDESILACIDAATGDQKWKGGRYGYGQIMLAGSHLIVLTEDGEVVLVKAAPDSHQELARFKAIEGKTWNHPIIAGGQLIVRNIEEMAAFKVH